MELSLQGLKNRQAWERAGIALPTYDIEKVRKNTADSPRWVHFGIGNIFRIFLGSIADALLSDDSLDSGFVCAETYDFEVVDRIYRPYDNLMLSVILNQDGTQEKRVLAPFAEALKAQPGFAKDWARLREVFASKSLQMVSFTITEKGYQLTGADGAYTELAQRDFASGPEGPVSAMAVVASLLYHRYQCGKLPVALVSMDNCSHNGERLQNAVTQIAREWVSRGFCDPGFLSYLQDGGTVSFPWTMIDKITPRPEPAVRDMLESLGVSHMDIVETDRKTFIAPFGNAEKIQYLVIEDTFPNGRPPLEKAGVYMTDRETVNKAERMKVCTCLNPIHTALCTYDCMLGYEMFADGMKDPELHQLACLIGYQEGMKVVTDPGILSPKAFLDEVLEVRMPNPYLGDTSQRIAVDISQMVGIRFGHTIRAYMDRFGSAKELTGIPLAIAGWIRYLLAVDDKGMPFDPAPDPMLGELQEQIRGIESGDAKAIHERLSPVLSNANLFGVDLYEAGIGTKIEQMVLEETQGPGAVRRTLRMYLKGEDER